MKDNKQNKPMRLMVVLPTYNERDNLEAVAGGIYETASDDLRVGAVVVDDASPDGTGALADRLSEQYEDFHVIHRRGPRGRGLAGIDGFRHALASGAACIMEMDADGSHQPRYIPDFLEALGEADVVIGSRLIEGGSETGRHPARSIVTRLANIYLRTVLGVPVRDCTSGFRCFRREALESVGLDTLRSRGPSLVEEILIRCHRAGCRFKEIPIEFTDRHAGESTFNAGILLSCLFRAIQFRFDRSVKRRV
jgi:dolichol-phosphate mannosyltransferase